jgi:hypothetical protein
MSSLLNRPYDKDDEIKEDGMDMAYSTHGVDEKLIQMFDWKA